MSKDKKNRGLGRGLSALMEGAEINLENIGDDLPQETDGMHQNIAIELLHPNPEQPRSDFDAQELDDLAASINECGIIQPLIVRPDPKIDGAYQIIAGERRWRAAQKSKMHEVPVIVRNFSDREALEIAIIENIQRADLNAIEEAEGYKSLIDRFGFTQEKLAISMGKSRTHITNILRLLALPEEVKQFVRSGALSMGHARALLSSDDPCKFAEIVMIRGLSVRATENFVKNAAQKKLMPRSPKPYKDADTRALEHQISANIGLAVSINQKPDRNNGSVLIQYRSVKELEGLVSLLCNELV